MEHQQNSELFDQVAWAEFDLQIQAEIQSDDSTESK